MIARPARYSGLSRSLTRALGESPLVAPIAFLGLMLAGVAWVHGGILFNSPLLIDEHHTVLLAEKGSFFRSMADLAAGSDFNPPLLYILERAIGRLSGGITPVSLRVTSFVIVWLVLVVVWSALRRLLSPSAAFVGSFSVWSNNMVVDPGLQGRFYAPWLLFDAMVLWSLGWDEDREVSRRRDLALAVSSALVCTIHYFGIFSLSLIAIGAAVWIARTRRSYRRLLPMIAGPIALAACIPFFLGQRSALTVKTWIAPLSPHQIREMLETYLAAGPLVVAFGLLLGWIGWRIVRRTFSASSFRAVVTSLPFLALLLMPLTLLVISVFVQPSMQLRYAIPASLAWAPIVGFAARPLGWPGKLSLVGVLFFFSIKALDAGAAGLASYRAHIRAETLSVTPFLDSGLTLMVPRRSSLYPLADATRRPSQLVYPDFTDSVARSRRFPASMVVDRDVARVHQRRYGFPTLESIDARHRRSDLYFLVPSYGTSYILSLLFPDDDVNLVASRVYRVRARDGAVAMVRVDPVYRAMKLLNDDHDAASAITLLDSLLAYDPKHYGALWQRASALEALGRKPEAIRAWRTVISEAEQYGWRDGLQQARKRLTHLLCGSLSPQDRDRLRLSLSASILQWYRCSRMRAE